MNQQTACAHCGKSISVPEGAPPDGPHYCSFGCEVKALVGKTGWGMRWFGISLAWGLAVFALLVVIVRPFIGMPVKNPAAYWGFTIVLGLIVGILSIFFRRMKH